MFIIRAVWVGLLFAQFTKVPPPSKHALDHWAHCKVSHNCLILLYLSAAFHSTFHSDILLDCLYLWFGIHGTALNWFTSYLSGRLFGVKCLHDVTLYTNPFSHSITTYTLMILSCLFLSNLLVSMKTFHAYKLLSVPLLPGWLQTFCVVTVPRLNFCCWFLSLS